MKITALGHAGFYVETPVTALLMDPWLSKFGAFDSSWFQYPRNDHMLPYVLDKFEQATQDKYIYISHEHKDHFDLEFLKLIKNRNFKIILANFKHSVIKDKLASIHYKCEQIILLNDNEVFTLKDGSIQLFLVDAELDCDSSILVKTTSGSFLNVNDCKIHDRYNAIHEQHGHIDVFASQFSGAIWHPICYEMSQSRYEKVSLQKKNDKFQAVSAAIEKIQPTVFLASAGPPCFLDPLLMPFNFQKISIFPRAPEFLRYLDEHCQATNTKWPELMPGDELNVTTAEFTYLTPKRVDEKNFVEYIHQYAHDYKDYFSKRQREHKKFSAADVFMSLKKELENKLKHVNLDGLQKAVCLYWCLSEEPNLFLEVNFKHKTVKITQKIADPTHFWKVEAPAWQVQKVLTGEMNWPDFVLTFRVKLKRIPDLYDEFIHGFIALDACEIASFCRHIEEFHANKERMIVEINGKRYSILRWCPHLGGDLSQGWAENGTWVCPRHHWHFDVCNKKGACLTSNETIKAIELGDLQV